MIKADRKIIITVQSKESNFMVFFTRTSNKKRLMLRMQQRWIPGFGLKTSAVCDVKSSHSIARRRYYTHMWCCGEDGTLQNCPAVRHYHFNFPEFTSLLSFCARRSFHSAAKNRRQMSSALSQRKKNGNHLRRTLTAAGFIWTFCMQKFSMRVILERYFQRMTSCCWW